MNGRSRRGLLKESSKANSRPTRTSAKSSGSSMTDQLIGKGLAGAMAGRKRVRGAAAKTQASKRRKRESGRGDETESRKFGIEVRTVVSQAAKPAAEDDEAVLTIADTDDAPLDLGSGAVPTDEASSSYSTGRSKARPRMRDGMKMARSRRKSSFGALGLDRLPSSPLLEKGNRQDLVKYIKGLKRTVRLLEEKSGPASQQNAASVIEANHKAASYAVQLSALQGEVAQLKGQLSQAQEAAESAETYARLAELEASTSMLEAEKESALSRAREAQSKADTAEAEAGRLQSRVDELEIELEEAREQLEEVQGHVESARSRASEAQQAMEDATAEAASYRYKFESSDSRRAALEEKVLDLQGAIRVFVRVRPTTGGEKGAEAAGMEKHMAKLRRVASGKQVAAASRKGAASSGAGGYSSSSSSSASADEGSPLFEFPAVDGEPTRLVVAERPGLGTGGYGVGEGKRHTFDFQKVFSPLQNQAGVFEEVKGLVHSAIDGHRVAIFAYGQTGAGKTYTMMGPEGGRKEAEGEHECRGIIPRAIEEVFSRAEGLEKLGWAVQVRADVCEIYNEKIRDLAPGSIATAEGLEVVDCPTTAVPSASGAGGAAGGGGGRGGKSRAGGASRRRSKAPASSSSSATSSSSGSSGSPGAVTLRLDPSSNTSEVHGLQQVQASSAGALLGMLQASMAGRATKGTKSNATSSRSHAVFRVFVRCEHAETKQVRHGVLNLVDLAGSERVSKSGADKEAALMREASSINKSLTVLGQVMRDLAASSKGHTQFRGSVLTRMLQSSLTDGAKALMICNLCPLHLHAQETLCSLRFAVSVSQASTQRK